MFLGRVIEMGKVDEEEVWAQRAECHGGRSSNPLRTFDIGQRSPEMLQRKVPQRLHEIAVQHLRFRVTPQRLAPVRMMDGRRHAHIVGTTPLGEHGKPYRRPARRIEFVEPIPDLRRFNDFVAGGPHLHFVPIAPIEAVGDHTMVAWQLSGNGIRLNRPRDARSMWFERTAIPRLNPLPRAGHVVQIAPSQSRQRK